MVGVFYGPNELFAVDIFDLLGLDPTGPRLTWDQIIRAARHVVLLLHPDRQVARPIVAAPYTSAQANMVLAWATGRETGRFSSTPNERLNDLYDRANYGHRSTWNPQGNQWDSPGLFRPLPSRSQPATAQTAAATGRRSSTGVINLTGDPTLDEADDSDDSVVITGESPRRNRPTTGQTPGRNRPTFTTAQTPRRDTPSSATPGRNWAASGSSYRPTPDRAGATTGRGTAPSPTPTRPQPTNRRRSGSPTNRPTGTAGYRQRSPPVTPAAPRADRDFHWENTTPGSFNAPTGRRTSAGQTGAQASSSPPDSDRPLPDPRRLSLRRLTVLAGDRVGTRVAIATIPARGTGSTGQRVVVTLGADARGRVRFQILSIDLNGRPVPGGAGQGNSITYDALLAAGPVFLGRFRASTEEDLRSFALALRANPDADGAGLPMAANSP